MYHSTHEAVAYSTSETVLQGPSWKTLVRKASRMDRVLDQGIGHGSDRGPAGRAYWGGPGARRVHAAIFSPARSRVVRIDSTAYPLARI